MKRKSIILFIFLGIIVNNTFSSGSRNDVKGSKMAPYNKNTVTTVDGIIESIDIAFNKAMEDEGIHLTINTGDEVYIIHVCPKWYADKENIMFILTDKISVTGSEFNKDNLKNIYASTIITPTKEYHFREKDTGEHYWIGRNQNQNRNRNRNNNG